ncbi:MAG: MFS transporter [Euryarchaeota archaeon]|nr:MFS transporter [Euryarchaeota archaeon]
MRRLVTTLRTLVRRFAKGYGSLGHLKNPDLALLALAGLFASMSHSIIVPLLPAYADSLGAGPVFIGLLFGAPAAVQAICSPLFGYLADRMARKPLICFGIALGVGSVAALGVASGPLALLALRGLDGLALAMQQPATTAYIGDQYADDERGGALGAFKSAGLVGVAVGPALGGALSLWGTLGTPFLVLGTVTVFVGVFLVFRLPRARPSEVNTDENDTGGSDSPRFALADFRGTLTISMVALAASVFVSQLGTGAFGPFLAPLLEARVGGGPEYASLAWSAFGLAMVLAMPIGGTLADRWGRKPMLIVSKLVWAAVVCGPALATVPQIPPVLLLVAGVASAFGGPAMGALQYEVAPKGREATVLGIYSALASAGVAVGPILGGWVVGQWGLVALFLTMGALWAADTLTIAFGVRESNAEELNDKQRTTGS